MEQELKEFHDHIGLPEEKGLEIDVSLQAILLEISLDLGTKVQQYQEEANRRLKEGDATLFRILGKLEEIEEFVLARQHGDIVAMADSLGDLLYWVVGSMVVYGIPVAETFEAIHTSNMSKQKPTADNIRLRDKGPNYRPPDFSFLET